MFRYLILSLLILIVVLVPWQSGISKNDESSSLRFAKDHIIVKLKPQSILAASVSLFNNDCETRLSRIASSLGISLKSLKPLFPPNSKRNNYLYIKYELGTYYLAYFENEYDPLELSRKFETDKEVDFSEPDFKGEAAAKKGSGLVPNDQYFNKQWGMNNTGTVRTTIGRPGKFGADMNVLKGWEVETGSKDIIVAILDSGVKLDHPDLSGRIWNNPDETKNGKDDDNNGYVDDVNGYNFAYDNSNVKDDGGHGTNIAGTIGATTNNSIGYAGMDQNCMLMICKNLDNENLGEYSWWSTSLYYAADNGAKVINMSEGGYDYSKTLASAIKYAYESGCLIVASMMNKNNSDTYYPASMPEVMAVGATDTDDSRCTEFTWGGGSNWGKHISVVAPGNRIYGLDYKSSTNYDVYWSGTSQATAYVSAIASILLAQDPARKNTELKEIITATAVDQVGDRREDTPGKDDYYGYGRVDLFAALTYGNFPSGNKKEKNTRDYDNKKEEDHNAQRDVDDRRAKAEDQDNPSNNEDDKRAKKYGP